MLRIDETTNTLVAPEANGFVAEPPPARDDLLTLLAAGWEAFAGEIGQKHVRYLMHTLEPGVDLLAFDQSGGRITVVLVGATGRELLGRAVLAGSVVAGWTAEELAAADDALKAVVPGESPRLILVAPEWDARSIAAADWLDRRHGLEIRAFKVATMRFGSERMMTVDPAVTAAAPGAPEAAPDDAAAQFFAHVSGEAKPAEADAPAEPASTPPPISA